MFVSVLVSIPGVGSTCCVLPQEEANNMITGLSWQLHHDQLVDRMTIEVRPSLPAQEGGGEYPRFTNTVYDYCAVCLRTTEHYMTATAGRAASRTAEGTEP